MKCKFFLSLFCALLSFSFIWGKEVKGNGNIVTKEIPVSSYSVIEFGENLKGKQRRQGNIGDKKGRWPVFEYSQKNGSAGLSVTTDENLFEYLDMQSINGTLVIKTKRGNSVVATQFLVTGHSENLQSVMLSYGADLNIITDFSGDQLKVQCSGGSDFRIKNKAEIELLDIQLSGGGDIFAKELKCNNIAASLSGGSDAHLGGKTEKAVFNASGGSDVKAYDLIAREVTVSVSGGSDVFIHATEKLSGSASGGSDIRYKGDPVTNVKTSGGSDCKRK